MNEQLFICSECGVPFFYISGISYHFNSEDIDEIDWDLDRDHVAFQYDED